MRTHVFLAAVLLSLSAVPAAANGRAHFSSRFCTSGSLTVCASVRVGTVSYTRPDGTTGTHVTLSVANYSGWHPNATRPQAVIDYIYLHSSTPGTWDAGRYRQDKVEFRGNAEGFQTRAIDWDYGAVCLDGSIRLIEDFDDECNSSIPGVTKAPVPYGNWLSGEGRSNGWFRQNFGLQFHRAESDWAGHFFGCDGFDHYDSYISTCAGGRVGLSFDVPYEWSAADIDGVGLFAGDFTDGDNDLCVTPAFGVEYGVDWYGDDYYTPCTVIPEPISLLLLGTGLAGIGGAGMIRRRNKDELPPRARP